MKYKIVALIFIVLLSNHMFSQTLKVGDKAPEIIQTMVDGSEFKLSDLKGKVVLIDFWASWCGPCRRENPNIIKVYQKFKDVNFKGGETGFTVLSVSLDMKKNKWVEAIEKDGLIWQYHVSDLKGWLNEAAKLYDITSVPTNYLVDGEGKIIAINLRGSKLLKEIKKYKKGFF